MTQVERSYIDRFGQNPDDHGGWYEPDGWKRISRVFERLEKGGDILDVGTGAGQFVNCLALSDDFRSVTTIDPTVFNKYIELCDGITRYNMSVASMDFDDGSFDVVTCMEVLEHLPEQIFLPAISELRRVCRGQLIVTVPYREPEPISRSHVRRFEDADLANLFPHATFAVLDRPNKPWMLIDERPNRLIPKHADPEKTELILSLARLEGELEALRARWPLRAANWVEQQTHRAGSVLKQQAGRFRR